MKKNDYLHFSSEDEDNESVETYVSSIKEDNQDTMISSIRFYFYLLHIIPPDEYHNKNIDDYLIVLFKLSRVKNNKIIWYWEDSSLFNYSDKDIECIIELIENKTFYIYNRKNIKIYEKSEYDTQDFLNCFYVHFMNKSITQEYRNNIYKDCVNISTDDKYKDKVYTNYILELYRK